ncbi:hypothetical protein DFH07DRAFT_978851, partial [Mycena maculata]
IASLKQVIAPIRKLPAELLVQIFLCTIDPYSTPLGSSNKDVLVLCGVCAHWRQLVCTTPQLWARQLAIKAKKSHSDTYLAIVKTFLERSAPHPIPISLNDEERTASEPLVDFILTLAPRWKSLNFNEISPSKLCQLDSNALRNPESVDLRTSNEKLIYGPAVRVFLDAPRLRSVTLEVLSTTRFPMPWSQLTYLAISEQSSQLCLDIILQCINIVTVKFTDMEPWIQPPGLAPIVQLPRLEDLEVAFFESDGDIVMPFFTRLDLPALRILNFHPELDSSWSSADFTPFQRRSPNIQELTIENCSTLDSADLICVLQAAPNLVKLDLALCMDCIDDSVFDFLQYSDLDVVHSVPQLREFQVSYAQDDFEESTLENAILSRWWSNAELLALPLPPGVARWEVIAVDRGGTSRKKVFSQKFKSMMERLRSQGLQVKIG